MAAGMGSRFGGLKQIEPIGPNGEFLIDYSIYDAIKAGFNKVVFVIKKENEKLFKDTVGKRIENVVDVDYAFQDVNEITQKYNLNVKREKPWGTAHAIMCAEPFINEPFVIINADDFYGSDSFVKAYDHLLNNDDYCVIGYPIDKTLSSNGAVKRGICNSKDDFLVDLIESNCEKKEDKIIASPLDNSPVFDVDNDCVCSMNMLGFNKGIFSYLNANLEEFLNLHKCDILNCEYLIPDLVYKAIKDKYAMVHVVKTTSNWMGITYKDDLEEVKNNLNSYINQGLYPLELWK